MTNESIGILLSDAGGLGWGDLFSKYGENNKILWIINGIRKQPIS